ncbi:hypothetical protein M5K25_004118 [Dendrobium thyrsiflorum]|uniref:Uncharacterized protein n=1 Tax=Dendrobium thyrsiflorum TaxID=117978 RepID=A0ABD0VM97_DENTH
MDHQHGADVSTPDNVSVRWSGVDCGHEGEEAGADLGALYAGRKRRIRAIGLQGIESFRHTTDIALNDTRKIQIYPRATLNRLHFLVYSLSLLLLHHHTITPSSFLLLLAEDFLTFMWLLAQGYHWHPFPELLSKVTASKDFPALDVFICTADTYKKLPVGVASTALSALAFDYPSDRLYVYVSDDGGLDLTLFAFFEAPKFARCWLPFCRENGVMERSPEAYFQFRIYASKTKISVKPQHDNLMFESLKERVDCAMEISYVDLNLMNSPEEKEIFKTWKNFTRNDLPLVIQVLLESKKDKDITGHPLPNLIYISREKHPASPHNFKAGALNALVSPHHNLYVLK